MILALVGAGFYSLLVFICGFMFAQEKPREKKLPSPKKQKTLPPDPRQQLLEDMDRIYTWLFTMAPTKGTAAHTTRLVSVLSGEGNALRADKALLNLIATEDVLRITNTTLIYANTDRAAHYMD